MVRITCLLRSRKAQGGVAECCAATQTRMRPQNGELELEHRVNAR